MTCSCKIDNPYRTLCDECKEQHPKIHCLYCNSISNALLILMEKDVYICRWFICKSCQVEYMSYQDKDIEHIVTSYNFKINNQTIQIYLKAIKVKQITVCFHDYEYDNIDIFVPLHQLKNKISNLLALI